MKSPLALVTFVALAAGADAQTVLQDVVSLDADGTFGPPFGQYALLLHQDAAQTDPTWIRFDRSDDNLVYRTSVIDEGADWYFVSAGDIFGHGTSATSFSGTNQSYSIPAGEFYMGVATGQGFTEGLPNRSVFGWALLRNSGGVIELLDSAVAYDASSIQVGTANATPIPEPATAAFAAAAACGLLGVLRRRGNG